MGGKAFSPYQGIWLIRGADSTSSKTAILIRRIRKYQLTECLADYARTHCNAFDLCQAGELLLECGLIESVFSG